MSITSGYLVSILKIMTPSLEGVIVTHLQIAPLVQFTSHLMTFLNWVQEAIGCKVEDEYGMVHVITGGKLLADSPMWPMVELTDDCGVVRFATLDRFEQLISVG